MNLATSRQVSSSSSISRMSSSSLDPEAIPFETLGSDLSMDEAVRRVRELTKENQSLRVNVEQSNELMKRQCTVLTDWRDKWEQEREQVRQRHDQAKVVVIELRSEAESRDKEIEELRKKLQRFQKDDGMKDQELELLTLRQHKVALCEQLENTRTKSEGLEEMLQKLQEERDDKCQEIDRYMKLLKEANEKTSVVEEEKTKVQSKLTEVFRLYEAHKKTRTEGVDDAALTEAEISLAALQLEETTSSVLGQDHVQGQTMSSVLQQLQDERQKVSDLMADLQEKTEELETQYTKSRQLEENHVKTGQEHQTATLKKEREITELKRQLATVSTELRSSKSTFDSQVSEEEQRNLKAQVQSLVGELRSAEEKAKNSADLYARQKERMQSLESQVNQLQDQLEKQRGKDDQLIRTLQTSIKNLEDELTASRQNEQQVRQQNVDMRHKLNVTASEFQEHLKACRQNQPDFSVELKKKYEMHIDNLTAQILVAEETVQSKNKEIHELKEENERLQVDLEDTPILRAQVEVYKADFEAERSAREREHDLKCESQEEVKQLHLRNQQLQEELENMSSNQMAEIYRRHGTQRSASGRQDVHGPGATGQNAEAEDEEFECPKCKFKAPDLDTLQLHCLECIE